MKVSSICSYILDKSPVLRYKTHYDVTLCEFKRVDACTHSE